jgi:hypothetical protein
MGSCTLSATFSALRAAYDLRDMFAVDVSALPRV